MTNESNERTYSTVVGGELATEIEADASVDGVTKSKAVRGLLRDGLRYREERGPVEMVLTYTAAMCLAAALGLFMLSVIVAAISYPLLPAFLVGLGSLSFASAAGVVGLLQRAGVGEWADRHLTARGVVA